MAGDLTIQGNTGVGGSAAAAARPGGSLMVATRDTLGDVPTTTGRRALGSTEAQNNCRENMTLQA